MINIKKILTIFLILMVLLPSVYAADTKTVDGAGKVDVSPSDTKPVTDDTKEKTTKITNKDKSITADITVTTKDVTKFSVTIKQAGSPQALAVGGMPYTQQLFIH
jgi:hypothetical protein